MKFTKISAILMSTALLFGSASFAEDTTADNQDVSIAEQIAQLRQEIRTLKNDGEEKEEVKAVDPLAMELAALKKELAELRELKTVQREKSDEVAKELVALREEVISLRSELSRKEDQLKKQNDLVKRMLEIQKTRTGSALSTLSSSSTSSVGTYGGTSTFIIKKSEPVITTTRVIYVRDRPPAPLYERRSRRPGNDYVWIDGYWRWDGHRYRWVSGKWVRPPHSYSRWKKPCYSREKRGSSIVFRFNPGSWDDDRDDDRDHHHRH